MDDGAKPRDLEQRTFQFANVPGAARFIEVPEMGHGGQHYLSMADAFAEKQAPFDPKIVRIMTDWLEQQQRKPAG